LLVRSELESDDTAAGGGLGLFESATALKEQVYGDAPHNILIVTPFCFQNKRLERELKVAKQAAATGGAAGSSDLAKLRDEISLLTVSRCVPVLIDLHYQ
jgi:hypothetical protein